MASGSFFLSGHIKGRRSYVTHDGALTIAGSVSNTAIISFNKKNTKANLYWDKDNEDVYNNDFRSDNDPLIGKFKVKKSVAKEIWGDNGGNYAWSGLFSIDKKGKLSLDFGEHGVMKGKISKKHKDFYSAAEVDPYGIDASSTWDDDYSFGIPSYRSQSNVVEMSSDCSNIV